MERPVRKDIRLGNYDYSRNGAYFVTICTKDKMCIFWQNNDKYTALKADTDNPSVGAHSVRPRCESKIRLSEFGIAVKKSFKTVAAYYPMIHFDRYVIMPNHIHAIIRINASNVIGGRTECAPTLSQVIKNFKENVTRNIGFSVWQRSFYDRIIRNEQEYRAFWEYIETNPMTWENDELFSKE